MREQVRGRVRWAGEAPICLVKMSVSFNTKVSAAEEAETPPNWGVRLAIDLEFASVM